MKLASKDEQLLLELKVQEVSRHSLSDFYNWIYFEAKAENPRKCKSLKDSLDHLAWARFVYVRAREDGGVERLALTPYGNRYLKRMNEEEMIEKMPESDLQATAYQPKV